MKEYNFWDLINDYKIIIPIIQRDYAQGRKDKQLIRKGFLGDIKESLDEGKPNPMEFVYGKIEKENEEKKFYPLDGQQRLTTLWLIHWFFALKGNVMSHKITKGSNTTTIREILKRFSYETRESSRAFCEDLCDKVSYVDYLVYKKNKETEGKVTLADFIKDRTWFYSKRKLDPTIDAMLRTISGDKDSDNDNIEDVFSDFNSLRCYLYYQKLADGDSTAPLKLLTFEMIEIRDKALPVEDDLYVKMNSRGKELTAFEDFKNSLDDWMKIYAQSRMTDDERSTILNNIDQTWTDVIWNSFGVKKGFDPSDLKKYMDHVYDPSDDLYAYDDKKIRPYPDEFIIDDSIYTFIKNYVINTIGLIGGNSASNYEDTKIKKSEDKKLKAFSALRQEKEGRFEDLFVPVLSKELITEIDDIFSKFSVIEDLDICIFTELSACGLSARANHLIPFRKDKDNRIVKNEIGFTDRLYFFAITYYVKNLKNEPVNQIYDYEELQNKKTVLTNSAKLRLKHWIRFCRNVIENCDSDRNVTNYITVLRLLPEFFDDIMDWKKLSIRIDEQRSNYDPDSYLGRQLLEEKEKAYQIYSMKYDIDKKRELKDKDDEINKIFEAESFSFFNGSIRFLYRDNLGKETWRNFCKKIGNIESMQDANSNSINDKVLVSYMKKFEDFDKYIELTRTVLEKEERNPDKAKKKETELDSLFAFMRKGMDRFGSSCWKQSLLWSDNLEIQKKIESVFLLNSNVNIVTSNEYRDFIEAINSDGVLLLSELGDKHYLSGKRSTANSKWESLGIALSNPGKFVDYIPIRWKGMYYIAIRDSICDFKSDGNISIINTDIQQFGNYFISKRFVRFSVKTTEKKYCWRHDSDGIICELGQYDKIGNKVSDSWDAFKKNGYK